MSVLIYQDFSEQIDQEIEKRRRKWRYPHIDFDDLAQGIRMRIYKKWDKWDQTRPFGPWVNTLITNYLINVSEETYTNYTPPCFKCVGDEGEDDCKFTESRKKCSECPFYATWEKSKKAAFDVKVPLSVENHSWEIHNIQQIFFNVEDSKELLFEEMKKVLNPLEYKVFNLMYLQNKNDLEIAAAMRFKTNEANRAPGYRQIKNYKDLFLRKAKEILKNKDIC
jgi:DNA-directed RNA polymerase specialized sigma24 family protein